MGKSGEEVWSLIKIVRVISIVLDVLFDRLMQNFCYYVVRANNVAFDFTITNFPLMNLYDLITEENKKAFVIGYAYIKVFLDFYFHYLAITDVDLAMTLTKLQRCQSPCRRGS